MSTILVVSVVLIAVLVAYGLWQWWQEMNRRWP